MNQGAITAPVGVEHVGVAAGDALIEFDRSPCTETEVPFCAFVVRLRSGAGDTHPLRRNR